MRVGISLQVRIDSRRLPRKALKTIDGMTLLHHSWRRALACREVDDVIVAIGGEESALAQECLKCGMRYTIGDEGDLISRHRQASEALGMKVDAVVRWTIDCLFHDPEYIDSMVRDFRDAYPKWRGMSNWKGGRNISEGLDAEIYTTEFLAELDRDPKCPREDFATYASKMDCVGTWSPWTRKDMGADLHLSIDTQADFERAEKMLKILGNDEWRYEKTLEAYRQVTE